MAVAYSGLLSRSRFLVSRSRELAKSFRQAKKKSLFLELNITSEQFIKINMIKRLVLIIMFLKLKTKNFSKRSLLLKPGARVSEPTQFGQRRSKTVAAPQP